MANEIYVDPRATTASTIRVLGRCYCRVGPTDRLPDHFQEDIEKEFDQCGACAVPIGTYEGTVLTIMPGNTVAWLFLKVVADGSEVIGSPSDDPSIPAGQYPGMACMMNTDNVVGRSSLRSHSWAAL